MEADGSTRLQGAAQDAAPLLQQQGECRGLSSGLGKLRVRVAGPSRAHSRCCPVPTP